MCVVVCCWTVSYWHRWVTAPPRERDVISTVKAAAPKGAITVLFVVVDVWLLIVQVPSMVPATLVTALYQLARAHCVVLTLTAFRRH